VCGRVAGESYYGDQFVECDLDADDIGWLDKFNGATGLLPREKFEMMLWKLEVSCFEATDRTLVAAGEHVLEPRVSLCGRGRVCGLLWRRVAD
jgi:hypothetical protein